MPGSRTAEAWLCAFDVARSIRAELMAKERFSHPTASERGSRAGAKNPLILRGLSATHGIFHPLGI